MEKTIDVIIPTYHPGNEFSKLIDRLMKQTCPIHQIIIMNTEEAFWDSKWNEDYPFLEVHHIQKSEFDHGGTRKKAAEISEADIMIFMTQDALPADRNLVQNLTDALLADEQIGAAYARQVPILSAALWSVIQDLSIIRKPPALRQKQIFRNTGSKHISVPMCVQPIKKRFLKNLAVSWSGRSLMRI